LDDPGTKWALAPRAPTSSGSFLIVCARDGSGRNFAGTKNHSPWRTYASLRSLN